MPTLVVAFSKIEESRAIKNVLVRKGYAVANACTTGAQTINVADSLSDGIIICGYKLADNMLYTELFDYKPKSFEMMLVASRSKVSENPPNGIVYTPMPLKVNDLLSTIEMMLQSQVRKRKIRRNTPTKRSPEEQKIIDYAKGILMERNRMSEQEAFRYIQKCSMDSGNTMVESANMVIGLYNE